MYYLFHWRQEQEHNATKKLGSNMFPKIMQEKDFKDTTKVKNVRKASNKVMKFESSIIRIDRKIWSKEVDISLLSGGKKYDEEFVKRKKNEYEKEILCLKSEKEKIINERNKVKEYLKKAPKNPIKKKFKLRLLLILFILIVL